MAETFCVRPMERRDIPAVMDIERASFAAPWSETEMEIECANAAAHYLVVTPENEPQTIAAYGGFWHIVDEGHITNIATAPAFRRKGCAKLLLTELIALAKSLGIAAMTLEVRVSNEPAQRLYEACGFAGVGVRPNYYPDNREGALIMWKQGIS